MVAAMAAVTVNTHFLIKEVQRQFKKEKKKKTFPYSWQGKSLVSWLVSLVS